MSGRQTAQWEQLALQSVATERAKRTRQTAQERLDELRRRHALNAARTHSIPSPSLAETSEYTWTLVCYGSNGAYAGGRGANRLALVTSVLDALLDIWEPADGSIIIVRMRAAVWRTYRRFDGAWVAS